MKFNKINLKNPRTRNILVFIVLALFSVGGWYNWVILEKQKSLADKKQELEKKQNELNNILALKPQLKKLESDIAVARVRLDSLKSIFPDQKEIPKLIREITGVARASEIYATRFVPQPDVQREYYVENHYDLSVTGGYHQLAQFFGFLANMPLIINLTNVSIKVNPSFAESKREADEHGSSLASITASFQMATFSSKK
jgi:type IV pilus assembly protein PilO